MTSVERAHKLKVVVLDACRNNPFFDVMRRSNGQKAISIGLARPAASDSGMLIAYAAREGTTAANGTGKNSPYAMALAHHIPDPGLDVRRLFGKVHDEVLQMTGGNQEPRNYDSLGGDDYFLTPPDAPAPVVAPPVAVATLTPFAFAPDAKTIEMKYWETVDVHDPVQVQAYLNQYPKGMFANLARAKIAAKTAPSTVPNAAAPPPPATPAVETARVEPPAAPVRKGKAKGVDSTKPVDVASIAPPDAVPLGATTPPPANMAPLPTRPVLKAVPAVAIPARFCSAKERNAFHSQTYLPAAQIAQLNNEAAIRYLDQIGKTQREYASAGSGFANVVTREFLDFKPVADAAFAQSDAYAKMYDAIMAVPVAHC